MQRKEIQREELKKIFLEDPDARHEFIGTFSKKGINPRTKEGTILLIDIYILVDNNYKLVTDHVWIQCSKRTKFVCEQVKENTKVKFTAKIDSYFKEGKKNYFTDYGIKKVRNVKIHKEEM